MMIHTLHKCLGDIVHCQTESQLTNVGRKIALLKQQMLQQSSDDDKSIRMTFDILVTAGTIRRRQIKTNESDKLKKDVPFNDAQDRYLRRTTSS